MVKSPGSGPDRGTLPQGGYAGFLQDVAHLLETARRAAVQSANAILTVTYWEVGHRVVEFEQGGRGRAPYGRGLLTDLSRDLTRRFGKGFSEENLRLMRLFYVSYPNRVPPAVTSGWIDQGAVEIPQTLSGKSRIIQDGPTKAPPPGSVWRPFPLSWSHYVQLLAIRDKDKRLFYESEAKRNGWSVRQLDRQLNSMLYERTGLSRRKGELLRETEGGHDVASVEEQLKDPYLLEFLGLPEPRSEKDLEVALINHLADFLLELGFGFAFVARQKRLQVGTESYYVDLLLYHRGLRCLVAVDLKMGKFTHADAGQMNLYLNYLREKETLAGENPPVGLILCAEKDDTVVRYALGGLGNKVFASRYKLRLPDPEVLRQELEMEHERLEEGIHARGRGL